MDHFLRLVDVKDKYTVEGGANLFPEHFGDLQKTLSLSGVRVGVISIPAWLEATVSLIDPLV